MAPVILGALFKSAGGGSKNCADQGEGEAEAATEVEVHAVWPLKDFSSVSWSNPLLRMVWNFKLRV